MRAVLFVVLAAVALAIPGQENPAGWTAPIVSVPLPAKAPQPVLQVQAPAPRPAEFIPQPIYTLTTTVRPAQFGSDHYLDQITLPLNGESAAQRIQSLTTQRMVAPIAGKQMPVLQGPEAVTLPLQQLQPQNEFYPVKQQVQQKQEIPQQLTQQVFAPYHMDIFRHQVPIEHVQVNRYIQPTVNRVVQPVLEQNVQEGKAQPVQIAQKQNAVAANPGQLQQAMGGQSAGLGSGALAGRLMNAGLGSGALAGRLMNAVNNARAASPSSESFSASGASESISADAGAQAESAPLMTY